MPLITALKNMNYSEINLITYVTDLYTKNYKKMLREIKDLRKWRGRTCLWIRTSKTVNLSILPKLIYRVNQTSIKSLQFFLIN